MKPRCNSPPESVPCVLLFIVDTDLTQVFFFLLLVALSWMKVASVYIRRCVRLDSAPCCEDSAGVTTDHRSHHLRLSVISKC